jgi:hypothetical protein
MPESTSPYSSTASTAAFAAGPQVVDLLRSQLVSVTEDRRRVMLWSAILAAGALMLVGRVDSLPWFLSLVPLALLTIWHACLLVRQRRYQAAWDTLLEKAADHTGTGIGTNTGPTRKAAAAASAQASQELGLGSTPAVLGALVAPSVLLFHGLLLGAVVTGGVMHEVEREKQSVALVQHETSIGSAQKVASAPAAPGVSVRPPAVPPRNFTNVSPRPQPAPSHGVTVASGRQTSPFPANAPRPQPLQAAPAPEPAPGPRSLPPATLRPKPVSSTGAIPNSPAPPAPPAALPAAPKPEAPAPVQ